MATRPSEVPAYATEVPPGQMLGVSGISIQDATIMSIEAIDQKQNADNFVNYTNGLRDWAANAQLYLACRPPIQPPPPPQPPAKIVTNVVYANSAGQVEPKTGVNTAWVWES